MTINFKIKSKHTSQGNPKFVEVSSHLIQTKDTKQLQEKYTSFNQLAAISNDIHKITFNCRNGPFRGKLFE